jgi:hypothetical protein
LIRLGIQIRFVFRLDERDGRAFFKNPNSPRRYLVSFAAAGSQAQLNQLLIDQTDTAALLHRKLLRKKSLTWPESGEIAIEPGERVPAFMWKSTAHFGGFSGKGFFPGRSRKIFRIRDHAEGRRTIVLGRKPWVIRTSCSKEEMAFSIPRVPQAVGGGQVLVCGLS